MDTVSHVSPTAKVTSAQDDRVLLELRNRKNFEAVEPMDILETFDSLEEMLAELLRFSEPNAELWLRASAMAAEGRRLLATGKLVRQHSRVPPDSSQSGGN
jgi:hypothetical protein